MPVPWQEALRRLQMLVMALLELGLQKGHTVGIISHTRMEWSEVDLSILASGGVTIGIFPSASTGEMIHIIGHSGLEICFVENDDLLDKLLNIRSETGLPRTIIVFETHRHSLPPGIISLEDFMTRGKSLHERDPARFQETWRNVRPEDMATIAYTSGTTGPPKGVMISHANLFYTSINAASMHSYEESDFGLAFLPLSHLLQRMTIYAAFHLGIIGAYAESIDKLVENFRELRPTVQVSVPQIFDRIYNRIHQMMDSGSPVRRRIFAWAISVGRATAPYRQAGKPMPMFLSWKHAIAHRLVFQKIHDIFGGRVKYLICGGAPMPMYLLEFFYAAGLLILEGYGLTETVAPAAVNRADNFKFGTVGQLIPGMEARIADDGELLLKGQGLFKGYYKDPDATRLAIDGEGWFHTGDIAAMDEEGFLTITDRKKDLIVTAGGKNIAPQNMENLIRTLPMISQAMVHGDCRKYLVALITLSEQELNHFAAQEGLDREEYAVLAGNPRVRQAVADHIDRINATLAPYERLRRFAILPRDFSVEEGELTPTLKIRRREIMRRYHENIDALYAD